MNFISSDDRVVDFEMDGELHYLKQYFPTTASCKTVVAERTPKLSTSELWHLRCAHCCPEMLRRLHEFVVDAPGRLNGHDFKCHLCVEAKMRLAPKAQRSLTEVSHPGHIVSCDTFGPLQVRTPHGHIYATVFVDHWSNDMWVYTHPDKKDYLEVLKTFFIDFREHYQDKFKVIFIRRLRTDNAGEFCSEQVEQFFRDRGVKHEYSNAYEHFQNGVAERAILTLMNMVRAMLITSGGSRNLWGFALKYAAFVKRFLPCSANQDFESPYFKVNQSKAKFMDTVLPFGCLMYVYRHKAVSKDWKLEPRGIQCAFLGYAIQDRSKAWIGLNLVTRAIILSSLVWTDETYFPMRKRGDERLTSLSCGSSRYQADINDIQEIVSAPESYYLAISADGSKQTVGEINALAPEPVCEGRSSETQVQGQKLRDGYCANSVPEFEVVGYDQMIDQYVLQECESEQYSFRDLTEVAEMVAGGTVVGLKVLDPMGVISFHNPELNGFVIENAENMRYVSATELEAKLTEVF